MIKFMIIVLFLTYWPWRNVVTFLCVTASAIYSQNDNKRQYDNNSVSFRSIQTWQKTKVIICSFLHHVWFVLSHRFPVMWYIAVWSVVSNNGSQKEYKTKYLLIYYSQRNNLLSWNCPKCYNILLNNQVEVLYCEHTSLLNQISEFLYYCISDAFKIQSCMFVMFF